MTPRIAWKNLSSILPWSVLALLAIINALLIKQNLQMRAQLEKLRPQVLRVGDRVQPFSAQGLRGDIIVVNYTGKEVNRILLYFSPSCPYCLEQFAHWKEILDRINRNNFQVIGLVSESEDRAKVDEYLRSVGCESMRVAFIPDGVLNSYNLSMTPMTIVIANDGRVEKVWTGKWDSEALVAASSIFGFSFSQSQSAP